MNQSAIFAIFEDADTESASFAERLLAQGIASRADARPFAMEWASKKYREPLKQGQRGATFARRGTAAEQAVTRVLQVCYPSADTPKAKPRTSGKTDPVSKLFNQWKALSAAEKRRFATMQLKTN
jgi:hypothetical protein